MRHVVRGNEVAEFWLTEEQSLLVATLSDAERAPEVRSMLIRVFVAETHNMAVGHIIKPTRGKGGSNALDYAFGPSPVFQAPEPLTENSGLPHANHM